MAVSLVTYVPDQLVIRRMVHIMQGRGQFHHTQTGPKMAAMYTYHINDILTQLIAELVKFFPGQLF